ncbi:unnamed protein product [Paramecium sonneborni]|uniref:Uncharacterized protein n=1 Tax=Paramecium sonneborni TaxID=65129 RepID=A0A8S1PKP0_9CILI|nr:unnamed protein product [Paramecium sonneborni]
MVCECERLDIKGLKEWIEQKLRVYGEQIFINLKSCYNQFNKKRLISIFIYLQHQHYLIKN